jgi:hypothetical protein
MRSVVVLVVFFLATVGGAGSGQAATIQIDFNSVLGAPFNLGVPYVQDGFKITSSALNHYVVTPPTYTMSSGDNTKFLTNLGGATGEYITIERDNPLDGAFNLDSLVLGTLLTPGGGGGGAHYSITSGLSTLVSDTLVAGSISPGLTNLTSVRINWLSGDSLAIDDIFLSDVVAPAAVPEPASAVALCFGSLALVVRRMRRRNPVVV